jgi:hypothetical protein
MKQMYIRFPVIYKEGDLVRLADARRVMPVRCRNCYWPFCTVPSSGYSKPELDPENHPISRRQVLKITSSVVHNCYHCGMWNRLYRVGPEEPGHTWDARMSEVWWHWDWLEPAHPEKCK